MALGMVLAFLGPLELVVATIRGLGVLDAGGPTMTAQGMAQSLGGLGGVAAAPSAEPREVPRARCAAEGLEVGTPPVAGYLGAGAKGGLLPEPDMIDEAWNKAQAVPQFGQGDRHPVRFVQGRDWLDGPGRGEVQGE